MSKLNTTAKLWQSQVSVSLHGRTHTFFFSHTKNHCMLFGNLKFHANQQWFFVSSTFCRERTTPLVCPSFISCMFFVAQLHSQKSCVKVSANSLLGYGFFSRTAFTRGRLMQSSEFAKSVKAVWLICIENTTTWMYSFKVNKLEYTKHFACEKGEDLFRPFIPAWTI